MLIEIHMIQNHGPSNLNRDDLGAPKTCVFGGVTRARISSQCLKRSIRRSPKFSAALEGGGGIRTRRLIELIAREAAGLGNQPQEKHCKAIREVFEAGGVGLKDENTFDILFFLPQSAISEMGKAVATGTGDLGKKFADILDKLAMTPDIALCGRMTEFDAKGSFSALKGKFTVEAALSAAHALSTHEAVNEVDYFTAADDIPGQDAGAAHVNEAMFNSACFYKHFAIDYEQLKKNLGGDAQLADTTVICFLKAAVLTNPSGKQHSFAAFNPPDGVLVEVKTVSPTPISYANAFAVPVREKLERGLIEESVRRLGRYAQELVNGYGIEAGRFWFSPSLRYRLTGLGEGEKQGNQQSPIVDQDHEYPRFDEFVNAVMAEVGATGTLSGAAR